ncbi:MAG: helix-turn-helix domain-containing protein [Rhodobacteraceae bacterium]|nr:helix-turn-helix domain-containing protein [Paracoccaceae bacterium]
MAYLGQVWYFSNMHAKNPIPAFGLYGEADAFPDVIHFESFSARAPLHDWRIMPHRHDNICQLFILKNGRMDATVDGTRILLQDQGFLYIPERCVHNFEFQPGTGGAVFSLPADVVGALAPHSPQIREALSQPVAGPVCDALRSLGELLGAAAVSATPFRSQKAVALAHSVLVLVAETAARADAAAPAPRSAKLTALETLIARHMADGWSASDYADALSISTGHLSRLCRAATGRGAAALIEQRVMQEACRLLAFTRLPVSQIGYRLGYLDPSYFSKRFHRVQGRTPSQYRAALTR